MRIPEFIVGVPLEPDEPKVPVSAWFSLTGHGEPESYPAMLSGSAEGNATGSVSQRL